MNAHTDSLVEANVRLHSLMELEDEQFNSTVQKRSQALAYSIGGVPDEYVAEFNIVLPGGGFTGPPIMGTLATSSTAAKEAAAILCQISLGIGLVKGQENSGPQHLGWNNLNKDAKGWCKAMLLAHAPRNATADELRDLLTAKLFASILVDHLLPPTPRAVSEVTKGTVPPDGVDG